MESKPGFDMENEAVVPEEIRETTPDSADQQSDIPVAESAEKETTEAKHKIKYNGEIRELTLDELKIAAQKGLNYDKVLSERDRLRASREFSVLDSRAAAEGLTRTQYLDKLESERDTREEAELVAKGMTRELAREHIRLKREADAAKAGRDAEIAAEKRTEELKKKLTEFQKLYPEVERLPDEVVEDIKQGTDLIVAYQKYEISRLRNAAAAGLQKEKNREKAVGSLADSAAGTGKYFSEGELDSLLKNGGNKLMDDDIWDKAVRSMVFHQKKKKG